MKILLVSQYFWPENFRINELSAGLVERGHEVTVLTGIPNYPSGKFYEGYGFFRNLRQNYSGAKVLRIPVIPRGRGGMFRLALNYLSFIFFAVFLSPLICRGKFDLIFFSLSPVAEGIPAVIMKKFKKASLIFWVQDLWPESLSAAGTFKNSSLHNLIRRIMAVIYSSCDKILVQSRAFVPFVANMGVNKEIILYFPNFAEDFYIPIDLDVAALERESLPSGFIVMFAGNIGASQDFETIISAAEKLREHKDIYWVILGDGRMRRWVGEEIMSRNLNSQFSLLGKYPSEEMPRYFARADVMLVSLKNEEIFKYTIPSKVQSYLACAKPVIASLDGEGAKIIEESGAGFSCLPESPDMLAQLVLKMYHMERSKRIAMGLRGREYFKRNFERTLLVNQLNSLINSL